MLSGCGVARQCRCLSIYAQRIIACLRWTIQLKGRQFWFQSRPIDEPVSFFCILFFYLVSARVGRCCPSPSCCDCVMLPWWFGPLAEEQCESEGFYIPHLTEPVSSDYPGAKTQLTFSHKALYSNTVHQHPVQRLSSCKCWAARQHSDQH